MTNRITKHIDERLNKLDKQLQNARQMYAKSKHESWAGRIAELVGRQEELNAIARMIQRNRI